MYNTCCDNHKKGELCFRYFLNLTPGLYYKESKLDFDEEKINEDKYLNRNSFVIHKNDNEIIFASSDVKNILTYEKQD